MRDPAHDQRSGERGAGRQPDADMDRLHKRMPGGVDERRAIQPGRSQLGEHPVPQRLIELVHLLPTNVPRVAESGVVSPDDAARVANAGYEYALVGSALMQGGDPQVLAATMLKAGRRSARPGRTS